MHRLARFAFPLSLALSAPALSHIVFDKDEGAAGGYYAGILRVSHGCDGSPTRSIRVEIPAAVISIRPQPKAGWIVKIEKVPLKEPVAGEGGSKITERVTAISWTGELPADQFDQFGVMMKLPANAGPLYFPTRQICASGQANWTNIPPSPEKWHDVPTPAPMITVKGKDEHDRHAGHGM